jgi:predicted amino acid dehydrogenase
LIRFAFLVHPLAGFQRRLMGIRRVHGPLVLGQPAGVDAVGVSAKIRIPTAVGEAEGLIVAVPDLADELVADQSRALALEERAARVAEAEGALVIGLGSALAVVAGRGQPLSQATRLPVTTGHASTAWATAAITKLVLAERGLPKGPVAVLGFQGAVGEAVAGLLAQEGVEIWVDGSSPAAEKRARQLGCVPATLAEAVGRCTIVVGASTTGPVLDPALLVPDTTLVDLALPPTLSPGPTPPGFRVVAGEALRVPGRLRGGFWGAIWLLLAQYGRGNVYACLAEPAAMALTGERGWSHGRRLSLESVRTAGSVLTHLGFRPLVRFREG